MAAVPASKTSVAGDSGLASPSTAEGTPASHSEAEGDSDEERAGGPGGKWAKDSEAAELWKKLEQEEAAKKIRAFRELQKTEALRKQNEDDERRAENARRRIEDNLRTRKEKDDAGEDDAKIDEANLKTVEETRARLAEVRRRIALEQEEQRRQVFEDKRRKDEANQQVSALSSEGAVVSMLKQKWTEEDAAKREQAKGQGMTIADAASAGPSKMSGLALLKNLQAKGEEERRHRDEEEKQMKATLSDAQERKLSPLEERIRKMQLERRQGQDEEFRRRLAAERIRIKQEVEARYRTLPEGPLALRLQALQKAWAQEDGQRGSDLSNKLKSLQRRWSDQDRANQQPLPDGSEASWRLDADKEIEELYKISEVKLRQLMSVRLQAGQSAFPQATRIMSNTGDGLAALKAMQVRQEQQERLEEQEKLLAKKRQQDEQILFLQQQRVEDAPIDEAFEHVSGLVKGGEAATPETATLLAATLLPLSRESDAVRTVLTAHGWDGEKFASPPDASGLLKDMKDAKNDRVLDEAAGCVEQLVSGDALAPEAQRQASASLQTLAGKSAPLKKVLKEHGWAGDEFEAPPDFDKVLKDIALQKSKQPEPVKEEEEEPPKLDLGGKAKCKRPACLKASWNGKPGNYCGSECRRAHSTDKEHVAPKNTKQLERDAKRMREIEELRKEEERRNRQDEERRAKEEVKRKQKEAEERAWRIEQGLDVEEEEPEEEVKPRRRKIVWEDEEAFLKEIEDERKKEMQAKRKAEDKRMRDELEKKHREEEKQSKNKGGEATKEEEAEGAAKRKQEGGAADAEAPAAKQEPEAQEPVVRQDKGICPNGRRIVRSKNSQRQAAAKARRGQSEDLEGERAVSHQMQDQTEKKRMNKRLRRIQTTLDEVHPLELVGIEILVEDEERGTQVIGIIRDYQDEYFNVALETEEDISLAGIDASTLIGSLPAWAY